MTILARAALLTCVPMVVACGAAEQPEKGVAWTGSREHVGVVEVVRNPAAPLHPNGAVSIRRLWTAPTPEADEVWEEPVAVRAGADGVYVLDRMAHRVYGVEPTRGTWQRSIGRRGGGPGELEGPFGLALSDAEVVVGDRGKASLERFGPEGEYRGSIHLDQLGFSVHALGAEDFLIHSLLGRNGGWKRVSRDGTVAPFPWPDRAPALPALEGDCARVSTAAATVFRLDCYRPAFQVVGASGGLVREVLVDRPAEAVPEAKLAAYLEKIRRTMAESGLGGALIEGAIRRERERFRLDPRMRTVRQEPGTGRIAVWEQTHADLGGGPARLHIFSADGIYLASIGFETSWVDFDWAGSRLYALVRDPATDLVRLTAYELALPEPMDDHD